MIVVTKQRLHVANRPSKQYPTFKTKHPGTYTVTLVNNGSIKEKLNYERKQRMCKELRKSGCTHVNKTKFTLPGLGAVLHVYNGSFSRLKLSEALQTG